MSSGFIKFVITLLVLLVVFLPGSSWPRLLGCGRGLSG
ncbi:Uncharacterised protein [Serratia fonticola]|uniref:Uncharacterized protein n=1 Tax=Serratia fonticola TaxID=47917 RepID=A0A448S654_SERFO|nr:Uncharacterised protein [Serratia fonticola]